MRTITAECRFCGTQVPAFGFLCSECCEHSDEILECVDCA